ncbi:MAG TPA: hypothetical protein VK307_02165 [Thermoleophilaceae bacterium]|nr:hypothetical protein [Thermoleophilaceae bacterium]
MAVAALLAPAGCSLGADEEPQRASGATADVAAVVAGLERATRDGDFATVCDDILTRAARERAGGRDCARLVRSASEGVRRPAIQVRAIRVEGGRARVIVRTTAAGQVPVTDRLDLRREQGEWRVEALLD